MELIVAELILCPQCYEKTTGHAHGKTCNVDGRVACVSDGESESNS
ncbi:MAG: hypothetical protein QGF90_00850 [Gammaproteobacteria bacterium]|nr:hypothetical protein [Gammaproteobacteria bacterium]